VVALEEQLRAELDIPCAAALVIFPNEDVLIVEPGAPKLV
jgi:hypothetical protein